jgi:hypothetical protein
MGCDYNIRPESLDFDQLVDALAIAARGVVYEMALHSRS